MKDRKNIILIGMPGAGKSTCGVLLAKVANMDYLDVDILIQKREGMLLQSIINEKGEAYFGKAEEEALLSIDCDNTVIATGGSAVYSQKGMEYLKERGVCVYLSISPETMLDRITNLESRGILFKPGETLLDMFDYRVPFYEHYADIIVDGNEGNIPDTVGKIVKFLDEH